MRQHTLILDVSNLSYRAFHTTGHMTYDGEETGVLFGIFRDVLMWQRDYATERIAFAFDGEGENKRLEVDPNYQYARRMRRKTATKEKAAEYRSIKRQVEDLRTKWLPQLGYGEMIFHAPGYEADDVIASLVKYAELSSLGTVTIVSADKDLFQCLWDDRVTVYNPTTKKTTTADSFEKMWRILPSDWAYVKAIAGCPTDGVPGVTGVAERTAIKYLKGEMSKTSAPYKRIKAAEERIALNERLVRLPFFECPIFYLPGGDKFFYPGRWHTVLRKLGMASLARNL